MPQILNQIVDVPVPQLMEETVEASKSLPEERTQQRTLEETVSVPVLQIQEQIVEAVKVKALFERRAVVRKLLSGVFFFFLGGRVTECKRVESVRARCNGRGPWFLVLDCAPQHILLLVGAVCPNWFHHDLH